MKTTERKMEQTYKTPEKHRTTPMDYSASKKKLTPFHIENEMEDVKVSLFSVI